MSWDGFQRAVLAELGLRAYVQAGAVPVAPEVQHDAEDAAPAGAPATIPPRLLAALARAAGCAPAQVTMLAGIASAPLDPASRRALWPRLRRLRRQRQ